MCLIVASTLVFLQSLQHRWATSSSIFMYLNIFDIIDEGERGRCNLKVLCCPVGVGRGGGGVCQSTDKAPLIHIIYQCKCIGGLSALHVHITIFFVSV